MKEWFGDEPDVDGDSKIFILLDDIRDGQGTYRGYFYAVNEFPRTTYPISNEKELLMIDIYPSYTSAPAQTYGTIAHEHRRCRCQARWPIHHRHRQGRWPKNLRPRVPRRPPPQRPLWLRLGCT